MNNRVSLCLAVLGAVCAFNVASASDTDRCNVSSAFVNNACVNQHWCVQAEDFAFRVLPKEDMSVQYLQHLSEDTAFTFVIQYLMDHPKTKMFLCWLRPLPTMHSVDFRWNVGLRLKSGETVWAEQWIYQSGGVFTTHDPTLARPFTPGVQGVSPEGCSFLVFCVFPNETQTGKEWRNGRVSGLVIE
jgi:hypothetical protein